MRAASACSGPWRSKAKRLRPETSFGEHAHDFVSLTLTLRGEYEEVFEDVVHACGPLAVQLKPRRVAHTTVARPGAELLILRVPEGVVAAARSRPVLLAPGVASAVVLAAFLASRTGRSPGMRLHGLFGELVEERAEDAPPPPAWIRAAERRLANELDHPPRLGELARDAAVHPVYFARTFRRAHGRSVGGWIRRARADRAVRALASADEDVAGLALRLGYYDQSHFGRDFRRETGWSPAAFRRALGFRSS